MAQERQTKGHSPESKADNHQRDTPQSNPAIFPKQAVRAEGHKAPADDGKKQSDEKLPLTWKSPEWVVVDVTLVYTGFAALTWLAIWRQVNVMKRQTSAMERCCYRCEPSRGGKHRLYEGGPDAYRGET